MTTPNTVADSTECVRVDLGPRSYEIVIGSACLAESAGPISTWLRQRFGPDVPTVACIVSDRNVAALHAKTLQVGLADAGWRTASVVLEAGEQSKCLDVVAHVYDRLVEMRADRQTVLIAVGGGVVGDAGGFAAATYARGIPFVQIPTTLLAQVDSSVGGKVGVNHPQGKNLIGAFYQPIGVMIDVATLKTLAERDYRSGLAEVIKYGVILDGEFFDYLERNVAGLIEREPEVLKPVVARSCRLKADVVEGDEEERTGLRAVLNYGHTFAHAFEAVGGYGTLLHGEAVSIGMVCASRLAERLGQIPPEATQRQVDILSAVGLPVTLPTGQPWNAYELLERMRLDKKATGGQMRFVLPTRIGHVELLGGIDERDVLTVLESANASPTTAPSAEPSNFNNSETA